MGKDKELDEVGLVSPSPISFDDVAIDTLRGSSDLAPQLVQLILRSQQAEGMDPEEQVQRVLIDLQIMLTLHPSETDQGLKTNLTDNSCLPAGRDNP